MKKSSKAFLMFALIGIVLIALLIVFGFRLGSMRVQAQNPPPQILIQRPINLEEIPTDEGIFVHATAWSEKGISRLEVWIDGEFIFAQDAPESGPVTPLLINSFWQPPIEGTHEIVVRAYDATWESSAVSVLVEATPPPDEQVTYYDPTGIIAAGEPSDEGGEGGGEESAAESGEEAAGEGGEEPAGGGEEVEEPVSSDSGGGGGGDYIPSDAGGGAPPEDPEPEPFTIPMNFGFFEVLDIFGEDEGVDNTPETEADFLKLEVLSLETASEYEGVHCYLAFGGRMARWFPDEDDDQDTDEIFRSIGDRRWNVADYLAEDNGQIVYWPDLDEVPIRANCIGVSGGGTEAFDLGVIETTIPPDYWDGVIRSLDASAEGSYTIEYRVTYTEVLAKGPTDVIPIPYNVHFDDRRQELVWEWERGEEMSGEIAGFLIFINDVLIYVTRSGDRSFWLPPEWLHPPCDRSYTITIIAYQGNYPDGDHSFPSAPVVFPDPSEEPRTDCNPEFVVTFETLVTGDLGGDALPNNWANMVQPVHGIFYANDIPVEFNDVTLLPDQTYNIYDLTSTTTGDASHFTFELAEGEYFRVGFDLIDRDGSSAEVLCSTAVYHDYTYSRLMGSGYVEDTLYSYEDEGRRCQVHYSIRPLEGTVVGASNPDFIPLPWLDVTGFENDPETGHLLLSLQNNGSAAWTSQPLFYELIRRDLGTRLLTLNAEISLDVGQEMVLDTGVETVNLGNLCIKLDPNNRVMEHYEALEVLQHELYTYCLPQPDLRIEDIKYDPDSNKLFVKIRNMGGMSNDLGSSDVNIGDIDLRIDPTAEGFNMSGPNNRVLQTLRRAEAAWIEWTLRPEMREQMLNGYTLIVDPDNNIYESDESNNTYEVPGGAMLKVAWDAMRLRWYPNGLQECPNYGRWATNPVDVWVDVYKVSEYTNERQVRWHWEGRTEGDDVMYVPGYHGWERTPYTTVFFIQPEEDMEIRVHGEQSTHSMGAITAVFEAERNWEITDMILAEDDWCDEGDLRDRGRGISIYPSGDWSWCGGWDIWVNICEVAGGYPGD
jgi:hypothetical protein